MSQQETFNFEKMAEQSAERNDRQLVSDDQVY